MSAESRGAHGARRGGRLTSGGYERPLYEIEADGDVVPPSRPLRSLPGEWSLIDVDVVLQPTAWMRRSKCAEHPQVDFFNNGSVGTAKTVCAACPVIQDCLHYATTEDIRSGVWGGTTPNERIVPHRRFDNPNGVVYFAVGDDPTRIKIGTSKHLRRRVRVQGLTLITTEPGSFARESALHRRFSRFSLGGEWFRYEDELFYYVAALRSEAEYQEVAS